MNRKRLEGVRADLAMARHFANSDIAVHAVERAEAALAAEESELRECDVGTMNEQADRYRRFCSSFARCRDCLFGSAANALGATNVPCAIAWMHMVHTPGSQGVRGSADQARSPREPHVGQEGAAAVAAGIQGILNAPQIRLEDLVTTSAPSLPAEMTCGVDLGSSDAGCYVMHRHRPAGPTVTERFELPF